MERIWKGARYWMGAWGSLAFVLVMGSGIGMVFMENASSNPSEYPAKLLPLGMIAFGLSLPGLLLWGMGMLGVFKRAGTNHRG